MPAVLTAQSALLDAWGGFLDLLYPPKCLVCEAPGREVLCESCREGFAPLKPPVCGRCGAERDDFGCRRCRVGLPQHLRRARSAARFEGPLRTAIHRLKYGRRERLGGPLGAYLAEYLGGRPFRAERFDLVIPAPLHASRLREREFNQAELLAIPSAKLLGIPLERDALRRTRATRHQVCLNATERAENVYDAFVVAQPERVAGKRVLLIDDVATTLSTLDECARVLQEAGAKTVSALTLAREL